MKQISKTLIAIFILNLSFINSYSQTITINDLLNLKNRITKPYETKPAEINGIVKSYIPKGFALLNYLERTDNTTNEKDVIHTLENNATVNGKEKITITTINNSSGDDFSTIEFNTSDFTLFQQWIAFIGSNVNFTEKNNEHMVYIYSYANDVVKIGTVTRSYARPTPTISEYETKVEPIPIIYFVSIKFRLL